MNSFFKPLVFLLLLSACQNMEEAKKPDRLIGEEKMVDILVDLAKIDAAMSYNQNEFEAKGSDPQTYIFEKYKIDSVQLAQNKAYYIDHPKINKRIFEKVKTRLENQREKLDSLEAAKDSLRRMKKLKKTTSLKDSAGVNKKIYPIDLLEKSGRKANKKSAD